MASRAFAKRFAGLKDHELKAILECQYKEAFGHAPNLSNPKTFNEKLNWEKLNYRNQLMTICADKVKSREYFRDKIPDADDKLVHQLGVFNSATDIDFDKLPNSFILKSNWGSGCQLFVRDKKNSNITAIRKAVSQWTEITSNHYYNYFEWGYKDIPPKIVAEEILPFEYKIEFFCFNGTPRFFWIVIDDKTKSTAANFYNLDWSVINVQQHYPNFTKKFTRPDNATFQHLIDISTTLAAPFPFVRCDYYKTHDGFRFSEMTFYHWGAYQPFVPESFDSTFGEMLTLPVNTTSNPL